MSLHSSKEHTRGNKGRYHVVGYWGTTFEATSSPEDTNDAREESLASSTSLNQS